MNNSSAAPHWQLAPRDVYRRFLATVRQLTGAAGASLLVSSKTGEASDWLYIGEGSIEPIPELATVATAVATVASLNAGAATASQVREAAICFYPSQAGDGCLLKIAVGVQPQDAGNAYDWLAEEDRREPGLDTEPRAAEDALWIGLRYGLVARPAHLKQLGNPGRGVPANDAEWLAHNLVLGGQMAWETCQMSSLLSDPITHLPGRAEFQSHLKHAFQAASNIGYSMGLVLVNPDNIDVVNRRLDRSSGDRALAEIAERLRGKLRRSDLAFRYGGAVFAVLLPKVQPQAAAVLADKIRRELTGAYLDGAVRLAFSAGYVVYQPGSEQASQLDDIGLLQRADHALNQAQQAGGDRSLAWRADAAGELTPGMDRLSGIFTANTEKDYRNMLLLWDTIAVVSSGAAEAQLASDFVALIDTALQPTRVGLMTGSAADKHAFLASAQSCEPGQEPRAAPAAPLRELLARAEQHRHTEHQTFNDTDPQTGEQATFQAFAVPLLAGDRYLGSLYLDGPEQGFTLDNSDLFFLGALANQLALALDREHLAARWKAEKERESRNLREQVQELRKVVHSARLVYCSPQMENVLETLRAVAATDVTILINGESGTGKEMLARAVHEQSERREKPLVTVDCGAIAHNLIESELFGHARGAFTGAAKASEGRVVQADGGTLFLDEIGELPLDLQVKLLRFVQEKEINPVGNSKPRRVDVRIVAATNRDLAAEVAAGNFREDLFYRLNVVTLTSPALRNRPDDILPLAQHFLEKFALQYGKAVHHFGSEAERALLAYTWPGNVRELQNCILRAVVLSIGDTIDSDSLQLGREAGDMRGAPGSSDVPAQRVKTEAEALFATPDPATEQARGESQTGDPWSALKQSLARALQVLLNTDATTPLPLGRWLTEELVLAADEQASGNARRASARLGVAETTYRRQLEKAKLAQAQGMSARPPAWDEMRTIVAQLTKALQGEHGDNLIEHARRLLLAEVNARINGNDRVGSALMGVTVPTYRRWLQED